MWIAQLRELLSSHTPARLPCGERVPSAVAVPLSVRDGKLTATFIQRSERGSHAHQISFPGGQVEEADADDYAAAVREMEEEIGVPARLVLSVGELSEQITPTGYWIHPFVVAIPQSAPLSARDAREVVEIFNIPLLEFQVLQGKWGTEFHHKGRVIWGVTARILEELLVLMGQAV
jgi:8-oxo-dGTP pyrophosphatase MutT (NUDIX family)